jgi:hypothetical protein
MYDWLDCSASAGKSSCSFRYPTKCGRSLPPGARRACNQVANRRMLVFEPAENRGNPHPIGSNLCTALPARMLRLMDRAGSNTSSLPPLRATRSLSLESHLESPEDKEGHSELQHAVKYARKSPSHRDAIAYRELWQLQSSST